MLNIDTLDTIIALVVVILLLSLIVQSIQGLVKKLLRLKSKQIEASLLDLFTAVLRDKTRPVNADTVVKRPMTALPGAFAPSRNEDQSTPGYSLLTAVKREMQELGRVDARGKFTIDSLSKTDLLNILARVAPDAFGTDFKSALDAFKKLEDALAATKQQGIPNDVSVLWAKFESALATLRKHYDALRAGDGTVPPGVIVADALALRNVVFNDLLDILAQVQEVAHAQKLTALETGVASISGEITAAREALDKLFGAFETKLNEIEQWFDTTMQGFEERYHRGMRTYSLIIAAVVVILLNADVFSLYRNISKNELLRNNLVNAGPEIARLQEEIAAAEAKLEADSAEATDTAATDTAATDTAAPDTATTDTATTDTATTDTATTDTATTDTATTDTATTDTATTDTATTDTATTDTASTSGPSASGVSSSGSATEKKQPPPDPREELAKDKQKLEQLVQMYTDFGLEPLTWDGLGDWFQGLFRCDVGDGTTWWSRRLDDIRTLFGWILMTLLLSLGAPFWHDALESLFGVKNLLRRRNEQQNVEQARGAGNPKV